MKAPEPVPPGPDEEWLRLKDLFEAARALPADRRPAYLAAACSDNLALRQEVEQLIASYERATTFLEKPVMLFHDEIGLALGLLGCTRPDEVARGHIQRALS